MAGSKLRKRRRGCAVVMAGCVLLAATWLALAAQRDTMAEPIIRHAGVVLPGMAPGAKPVTIALLSDFHPARPNMPLQRLAGIVGKVNALHPDVVVLAGDFVAGRGLDMRPYPIPASIAPLGGLKAPLGVFAVLGNHDSWNDRAAIRRELTRRGVTVLSNDARQVGPLAIGGLDDLLTGHARPKAMLAALARLKGGRVIVSHSPDPFARLPANFGLMLAGHTHCGQIRFFGWAPVTNSRYGGRFVCGLVREHGNTLIVTAGLGTSVVPVRLGARPDIWLIDVRPPAGAKKAAER